MANRFFTTDILTLGEYFLQGDEANHLAGVMRVQAGEVVTLFNGDGAEYRAEVVSVSKKTVLVNITGKHDISREIGWDVVVACAVPKGDRMDYLLEKLTETGCTRFLPLITSRSVVVPKLDKLTKWQRAVIEASKQCGRNRLMTIEAPIRFDQLLAMQKLPPTKWILHPTSSGQTRSTHCGVVLAIGPEGGFTDEEVAKAVTCGWELLSLGRSILRIETAALAGVVWAAQITG